MSGGARVALVLLGAGLVLLSPACAGNSPSFKFRPAFSPMAAPRPGHPQKGSASWYGPTFHGRTTASGERYNMLDLTAAHKSLPFDSYVRVTNLANARALVVRINDRGPFVRGRIIDLSYTAAKILDIPERGSARVRLEVMKPAEGARAVQRQLELVRRKGVKTWTDREYAELAALGKDG